MSVKKYIDAILALLFPNRCAHCKQLTEELLCANCRSQIVRIKEPLKGSPGTACDMLIAYGSYHGPLESAIKAVKFQGKRRFAKTLALMALDAVSTPETHEIIDSCDVLVPVPLHGTRRRSRGFNQAEEIAKILGELITKPVRSDLLERTRDTHPQFDLPREERWRNLQGAFRVPPKGALPQTIALIDDIVTTGATLHECAQALKNRGAQKVIGVTVALTQIG